MTTGYYCAIFPFCGGGKKKNDDKKTKAFYDWATTDILVKNNNVKDCKTSTLCHLTNLFFPHNQTHKIVPMILSKIDVIFTYTY